MWGGHSVRNNARINARHSGGERRGGLPVGHGGGGATLGAGHARSVLQSLWQHVEDRFNKESAAADEERTMLSKTAKEMSLKMRALEQARLSTSLDHLGRYGCRGCGSQRGAPRFSSIAMLAQHLIEQHGGVNEEGGGGGGGGSGGGGGGGSGGVLPGPKGLVLRAHTT